jgi:hypothetical protein
MRRARRDHRRRSLGFVLIAGTSFLIANAWLVSQGMIRY